MEIGRVLRWIRVITRVGAENGLERLKSGLRKKIREEDGCEDKIKKVEEYQKTYNGAHDYNCAHILTYSMFPRARKTRAERHTSLLCQFMTWYDIGQSE